MLGLERSSKRLDGSMRATGLQTGRLSSQFAGLASQIAGVHPVVGNLASVLGNFAVGGAVTAGVLLGVAAIAVAWDQLTDSTRKAREEQDKLIASLERTLDLKALGPGGSTVAEVEAATAKAAALKTQITAMDALIVRDAMDADVIASNLVIQKKINDLMIERQNALNVMAGGQNVVDEKVNEAIRAKAAEATAKAKREADALAAAMKKAADFAERYAAFMYEAGKWTANISGKTLAGLTLADANQRLVINGGQIQFGPGDTSMPNVAPLYTKEEFDKLMDGDKKNADQIRDAIWGSAAAMANSIVGALNLGGGGKGSNLGGALGGTAGFAAGFALGGPIGGAIGSTIGNIAGSLFGGLFDNKKEVTANTQALRQLTQAMLLYAPAGFKSEPYRYNASDPRPLDNLGRNVRWNASRGGANPLLGT